VSIVIETVFLSRGAMSRVEDLGRLLWYTVYWAPSVIPDVHICHSLGKLPCDCIMPRLTPVGGFCRVCRPLRPHLCSFVCGPGLLN
jgi:hypothetical protein